MIKRITAALLSLSLMLMLASFPAVYAAGEAAVKISASSTEIARGETVTYTLSFTEPQTVRGIQAGIIYDEDKFDPQSAEFLNGAANDAYVSSISAKNGKATLALSFEEDTELSGDTASFTFAAKDDAASGDAGFALTENGVIVTGSDGTESVQAEIDKVSIAYDYTADVTASADKTTVCGADEVTYTISVSDLSSMRGVSMALNYDTSVLTLTDAQALDGFTKGAYADKTVTNENDGQVSLAAVFDEPSDIGGDVLSLTFTVNDNVEKGEYDAISMKEFTAVDSESKDADIFVDFEADALSVVRAYTIEMSYTPDKAEIQKGEEVVYTVTLDKISTSRGFQTKLTYDTSKLELVSAEKGEILSNAGRVSGIVESTTGEIGIVCAYDESLKDTGVVATLTFKAKSTAADGYVEMLAQEPLAVDSDYNYVDAEGINNLTEVYIGRMPRAYDISVVTDESEYETGDIVYVTIDMGEVSKFLGAQFSINFDTEKLSYIAPEKASSYYGSVMQSATARSISALNAASGKLNVLVAFGESAPYSGSGDICTIAFEAINDEETDTEITLSDIVPKSGDTMTPQNASIKLLFPIYSWSYEVSGDKIEVTVKNNGGTDTPVLITAQYAEDGTLAAVDMEQIEISEGSSETYSFVLDSDSEAIKCMLWDSTASMVPYIR